MTQITFIGSIGISELVIFLMAPFVFISNYNALRQDGCIPFLWLCLLTCVSCCISSIINNTIFACVIRGFASPYALFAGTVVLHKLLRNNQYGLRFLLVGFALTLIINTFVFQRSVESMLYAGGGKGFSAAEGVMSSPIYWIGRLTPWVTLPIRGWYLQTSSYYSVLAPFFASCFALFTTASGRAASLVSLMGCAIILACKKDKRKMQSFSRNFILYLVLGALLVFLFKSTYSFAASKGFLGEKAAEKYEMQTHGRSDMLSLLMGGRFEFFAGLYASLQKPIWGYGPWARDEDGIVGEFLAKYGDYEGYKNYIEAQQYFERIGMTDRFLIPGHSHIVSFWLWYGIIGAILWIYVLYRFFIFFTKDIDAIVGWFGYFALALPSLFWDIFFSPFGSRLQTATIIVCLFIASSVRRGRLQCDSRLMPR